jgi:hypothetical protein
VDDTDNAPAMEILKPTRTEWGSFPDVLIHADESVVKQHTDYVAAKAGDVAAAKQLVADVLNPNTTVRIRDFLGGSRPFIMRIIPTVSVETPLGTLRVPCRRSGTQLHSHAGAWERCNVRSGNIPHQFESHSVLATTLTGKSYSAKLTPSIETIRRLRQKHGNELESWWCQTFGYGFGQLTESEARYLERSDDALTIRDRLIAARS